MHTLILLLTLIAVNIICCFIGWLATESKYRIVEYIPMLNFKPFNCKPCFTFHTIWIIQVGIAIIIGSWGYGIVGVIIAFITFFCLWFINKNEVQP